jgi:hypothetical protein
MTVELIPRLIQTAGMKVQIITVGGQESADVVQATASAGAYGIIAKAERLTYWQAMDLATRKLPDTAVVANVANDVLPVWRWFNHAYESLRESDLDGVIGFNGDGHDAMHACHFMTTMRYIRSLGGWPVWYRHNFGDTEICYRAVEEKKFYKHPWAILYHNHPVMGRSIDEAHKDIPASDIDHKTFMHRRRNGWIGLPSSPPA